MPDPGYADLPIVALWRHYTDWLRECMPDSHANPAPGASEADFAHVSETVGHELPLDVRALLSENNGQLRTGVATASDLPALHRSDRRRVAAVARPRRGRGPGPHSGRRSHHR